MRECRALLHMIGSASGSVWGGVAAKRGGPGRAGHVPFSVVPNANEDSPSALSQVQSRAVSELLRVAPVADELGRRFQEAASASPWSEGPFAMRCSGVSATTSISPPTPAPRTS